MNSLQSEIIDDFSALLDIPLFTNELEQRIFMLELKNIILEQKIIDFELQLERIFGIKNGN